MLTQQCGFTLCQKEYIKRHQGLTEVPTDIPPDVISVDIRYNGISKIKQNAFSQLSQCMTLIMYGNGLSEVEPGAFNGLSSLGYLGLGNNRLERLYVNMFSSLVRCEDLEVQFNHISEIQPGSFNGLGRVENIRFAFNRLTTLTAGTFQGLVALKDLDMSSNSINSIADDTFANLTQLQILNLEDNDLETLSPRTFYGLASLRELFLHGNHLTSLSVDVLSHLPRPLTLGLQDAVHHPAPDNMFTCDSQLCWLKQEEYQGTVIWFSFGRSPDLYKPSCVNGIDWDTWICNEAGKAFPKAKSKYLNYHSLEDQYLHFDLIHDSKRETPLCQIW